MTARKKEIRRTGWRDAWGILLLAFCVLLFLSVISYTPGDIRAVQEPPNQPAQNYIGPAGARFSFVLFMGFGVAGYLSPLFIAGIAVMLLTRQGGRLWIRLLWVLGVYLALVTLIELQENAWTSLLSHLNVDSNGGLIGRVIATQGLALFMGRVGAAVLAWAILLTGLTILFEVHPWVLAKKTGAGCVILFNWLNAKLEERKDRIQQLEDESRKVADRRQRLEEAMKKRDAVMATRKPKPEPVAPPRESEPEPRKPKPPPKKIVLPPTPSGTSENAMPPMSAGNDSRYVLPPLDLLSTDQQIKGIDYSDDHMAGTTILQETLAEFGIEARVTNVERGPVVTRYELLPAPGVRLERIAGLSNNIALVMKAESVRVQAPIPGKGVVGIEVPNSSSTMVFLREAMESRTWRSGTHALPLALGKDVGGHVLVADLAEMPHMLIAGATGSGKTVCMNSILAGLLMARTPDDMRLMLIDPKIVEFSGYEGLPHLVVPVITDPKKVGLGLRWAINEMEKRYKLFAKVGVRNIKSFNSRPIVEQTDMFTESSEMDEPKEERPPNRLPYIVIIVDELADLMLVAQAEIENAIARLAQLSRAVGIHMILATQRPSVNVITGTIKANFPARVAFQVAQKVDSRTILDAAGADKLLGKGDMLFLPPGSSKLIRAQGAMTRDDEIKRIVEFIRAQSGPKYEGAIKEKIESKAAALPEMEEDDEMMEAAIEVIRQTRRASTSSLQRRLRIGYTRAARLMDLLEERGVIGPPQGSDPREILIDLDGDIPQHDTVTEDRGD